MSALDDIRTALTDVHGTGPVLDGLTADDMVKAVVAEADMDAQAYPGELDMLRGLVRTLRLVVRDGTDMAEVQRLLHRHADDDRAARHEFGHRAANATFRRAVLLDEIRKNPAGRWKSGRAVGVLRRRGLHPISAGTASADLVALAAVGHLVLHGEKGVRWYEVARRSLTRTNVQPMGDR
ncbi:hypothetical protein [Streptomyces bobili]|uniref:hypothetical protein n=1 Tax=Streptomyces bobili TaxID=67280 RepID=UPI000A380982|nr:hypothetical protein [Streptomyces bobili]